jgi:hypothetical protein
MSNICYVMMPYGEKVNMANAKIDFDAVYTSFIQPAIEKAGLVASKTNEANSGEFLLKNMYARILFCRFAIADITFNNPNVYYELGIRHATRPHTTILIHENSLDKIPFDLSVFNVLNYNYDLEKKVIKNLEQKIDELSQLLENFTKGKGIGDDSPIAQLFSKYTFPEISESILNETNFKQILQKEDSEISKFEKMVNDWKKADAEYRISVDPVAKASANTNKEQINKDMQTTAKEVKDNPFDQYRLLLTVLKGYKDIGDSNQVVELIESIPEDGRRTHPELQEKLIFAYKKLDKLDEAEEIIETLKAEDRYTNKALLTSLQGSIKKRRAAKEEDPEAARFLREQAITSYLESFDQDPNSFQPGIAMLNLLYLSEQNDNLFIKYLPLVEYSIDRRIKSTEEYWALVSKIEIEAMRNSTQANAFAIRALLSVHAPWKREITIKHLEQIRDHKRSKGIEDKSGIDNIIEKFIKKK